VSPHDDLRPQPRQATRPAGTRRHVVSQRSGDGLAPCAAPASGSEGHQVMGRTARGRSGARHALARQRPDRRPERGHPRRPGGAIDGPPV
jgi:hypothetical protein